MSYAQVSSFLGAAVEGGAFSRSGRRRISGIKASIPRRSVECFGISLFFNSRHCFHDIGDADNFEVSLSEYNNRYLPSLLKFR